MLHNLSLREKGQTIVIVAIVLVVLLGMLAVIIDGGYAYANRRSAQNAADAAALAGARELCLGNSEATAESRANEYAITYNLATAANPTADISSMSIQVAVTNTFDTFFASVIGIPTMSVNANASAGCYLPCSGEGVLPIAWSCSPPAGGSVDPTKCEIAYGPGNTYIIMDTQKLDTDFLCQEPPASPTNPPLPGYLDCDLDNDSINEVYAGGDRSWLDLDGGGGGGAADWIENGFSGILEIHTWFNGQPGVADNVFKAIGQYRLNEVSMLPVYDQYCPSSPYNPTDPCYSSMWHAGDDQYVGDQSGYFHVINFSAFTVTCVDASLDYPPQPGHSFCPGKQAVIDANNCHDHPELGDACIKNGDENSMKTIEGYFVEGYVPGLSGRCGVGDGSGAYTIYLDN